MIQSHHILKDRSHQITLVQLPKDDTIPLQHHYSPFWGRYFRTTPSLSQKCLNFTWDRAFASASSSKPYSSTSSVCEYWTITICISSMWVLKASSGHHHLHLQYVNTETSSISSVWEYWNHHHLYLQYGNTEIIIIYIFSMGILKHHHLYIQYRNTESPSSVSTVCKYWNIIIFIFTRL